MTIDTLEYVKDLEAAGVSPQQAEAHARALKKAVEAGLATNAEIDFGIDSRNRLIWMVGFNLAATLTVLWKLLR